MSAIRRRNYGKSHAYYLRNADGTESKLDGVTTLINEGLAKPALINWAANTTANYAVDNWDALDVMSVSERLAALKGARFADRDAAAARGTQVHEIAERMINGDEVDVPDEIAGHVDSTVKWMDDWGISPVVTETVVYNVAAGYAGTLDMCVASDKVPGVFIADYKTSRSGIYSEAALQLAAYAHADAYLGADGADHPVADLNIVGAWGVWIRADGYSVYPLDIGEQTFRTFQFVATVARRARAMKESPLVGKEITLGDVA